MAAHGLEGLRKTRTYIIMTSFQLYFHSWQQFCTGHVSYYVAHKHRDSVAVNIKTDILGCDIDHLPNYTESLAESFVIVFKLHML